MDRPRILVIRKDDEFSGSLRENGFDVSNLELMKTRPVAELSNLRQKLDRLREYDGLFFTSPAAAEVFVTETKGREFAGQIFVVGERAKRILREGGFETIGRRAANNARELVETFASEIAGKRYLFLRGDKSMRTIPDLLSGKATVDEAIVYETTEEAVGVEVFTSIAQQIADHKFAWICFFSPSAVRRFHELFSDVNIRELEAAAIGTTTGEEARACGLRVRYTADYASGESFARGLIQHING